MHYESTNIGNFITKTMASQLRKYVILIFDISPSGQLHNNL